MKKFNLKQGFTRTPKFGVTPKGGGFTLIELLVVVAIIGILASVVLASLNSARVKGTDASIKSVLANARAQAELFYDPAQVYTDICTLAGGIGPFTSNAATKLNIAAVVANDDNQPFIYDNTGLVLGHSVCHDSDTAWAAIVSLKGGGAGNAGWCVDSTGASKEATSLLAGEFVCP